MTVAATSELPVEIRPMLPTDRQFVFETAVKVRWPRTAFLWADWEAMHGPTVDHWMRTGEVFVAESGGVLLGFVINAPQGVGMVYVKRGWSGAAQGGAGIGAGARPAANAELAAVVRAARDQVGAGVVLRATREALETYASGMGLPAAQVIKEFKALPEAEKFRVLAAVKDLEKTHQAYLKRVEEELNQPPESEGEKAAREARETYLRTGRNPLASGLVDRNGRPLRRD